MNRTVVEKEGAPGGDPMPEKAVCDGSDSFGAANDDVGGKTEKTLRGRTVMTVECGRKEVEARMKRLWRPGGGEKAR
ncbi:hypothetical protein L249_0147, partial [Ophiocordyceps polyrhachis-furcata BCC 54312]